MNDDILSNDQQGPISIMINIWNKMQEFFFYLWLQDPCLGSHCLKFVVTQSPMVCETCSGWVNILKTWYTHGYQRQLAQWLVIQFKRNKAQIAWIFTVWKCLYFDWNDGNLFLNWGPIENKSPLVQIMLWCWTIDMPFYDSMFTMFYDDAWFQQATKI